MNSLEKMLRDAIALKKAESPSARQSIYEAAQRSSAKLPPEAHSNFNMALEQAILRIEEDYRTDSEISPPSSELPQGETSADETAPDFPPGSRPSNLEGNAPPVFLDELTGTEENIASPKRRSLADITMALTTRLPVADMKSARIIFFGAILLFLLVAGIWLLASMGSGDKGTSDPPIPESAATQIEQSAAMASSLRIEFFKDRENLRLESNGVILDAEEAFGAKGSFRIDNNLNIISNEAVAIEDNQIFIGELKFNYRQPNQTSETPPNLYAGFYLLDETKEPLQQGVFHLFVHDGELLRARNGLTETEIVSGTTIAAGGNANSDIPKEAKYYRAFVGIVIEPTQSEIELLSYEIKTVQ